jgi:uncharacterized Tic20 family protein
MHGDGGATLCMCSCTALDRGAGEITPDVSPGNLQDRPAHRKALLMTDPLSPPAAPQPAAPLTEAEDRQWASFAHLGGILGFLPSLIIWLIFKDRGSFTNNEAKEALNFQITLIIAEFIGWITSFLLIGLLILPAVYVVRIIFSILGFLKSKDGIAYRYFFAVRLIK